MCETDFDSKCLSDAKPLRIAVLMAVYEGDDPIKFRIALESVIQQEINEGFNIYLGVDGTVPDLIEKEIEKKQRHLHKIYRSKNNIGLAAILNKLLAEIEGEEFIFRMDADDYALPKRFFEQIEYLDLHPEVGAVGTAVIEEYQEAGVKRNRIYPETHSEIVSSLCYCNPVAHPTICYRSKEIAKAGGYAQSKLSQDYQTWVNMIMSGVVFHNLKTPLLRLSISDGYFKRRSIRRGLTELKMFSKSIYSIHGLTWRLVYPPAKFIFRLFPASIMKWIYLKRGKQPENL